MKITERSFILVTESSGTIIVDSYLEELLRKEMRPILWFRDGLYCVISVGVLMNMLDSIDICKKLTKHEFKTVIAWQQGYQVPYEIGPVFAQLEKQC